MGFLYAILAGLISAVVYSLIQGCYFYFRWSRTRHFFIGEISTAMTYVDYHMANILNIETIYNTEYEEDHLITNEEFVDEIKSTDISAEQYKRLVRSIENTKDKIEALRKEALSVQTFKSSDFHATDRFLFELSNFLSYYSWVEDDPCNSDADQRLKEKLVCVFNATKEKPFHNSFLDNLWKWYRRNSFSIKKMVRKNRNGRKLLDGNNLPF